MTASTRAHQRRPVLSLPCKGKGQRLTRTCSSPAPSTCTSTPSTPRGSSSSSSKSRARLAGQPSSSSSSTSAREDESDESDDERIVTRLGGCCQGTHSTTHDDNNKENVAPLRHLTLHALEREEMARQEESVALRTRARAAGPMSDRSSTHSRRLSQSSSSTGAIASSMSRRTVSSPVTRKRLRGAMDLADLEARAAAGDADVRTPTTPLSRVRTNLGSCSSANDDAESYFSSQATSIFDSMSADDSPTCPSRCTTPDGQESEDKVDESSRGPAECERPTFANIYVHAKALLRYGTGTDSQVVGRHRERSCLQRFLQKRFNLFAHLEHSASPDGEVLDLDGSSESGSLYICGLPGTGKTALVRSILADVGHCDKKPRVAFVDCMSIQHPREIFAKILEALGEKEGGDGDLEAERRLGGIVKDARQRTLIVLDEIDHLLRNRAHQNILYRLFSWGASSPPSDSGACALIGIANSLDLTERFVPLLASKGAAPAVLNFRPFEATEIVTVMRARLSQLYQRYDGKAQDVDIEQEQGQEPEAVLPLIDAVALELAAKKVAAATGDLRKALDACRLAIDVVESEERQKEGCSLSSFTPTSAAKVKPTHVLKVLSTVLGSPQLTKIRALGLQSKLVLLGLLIAQKREAAKLDVLGASRGWTTAGEMRIGAVECTYAAMLKNDDAGAFSTLESSELMDVVEGLEVEGVIRIISDASTATGSSKSSSHVGVSPSGKRAAKKQLLASNRVVAMAMTSDDVLRGICTPSPASAGITTSKVVVEAMNRIWNRECDRIERSAGWETVAQQCQAVREEELGGGRGAIGI